MDTIVNKSFPSRGGGFNPNKEPERPLRGIVQDQKAAEGEERLARTLEKAIRKGIVRQHIFRWTTLRRSIANTHKELDELVELANGRWVAISVKGDGIIHGGTTQKNKERVNELNIIKKLAELGVYVSEIITVPANSLKTQEQADKEGRRIGVYK